jgi:hypothetical protein
MLLDGRDEWLAARLADLDYGLTDPRLALDQYDRGVARSNSVQGLA